MATRLLEHRPPKKLTYAAAGGCVKPTDSGDCQV